MVIIQQMMHLDKCRKKQKKLNDSGSSLIMVIVALGFIGILIGALLTSVSYGYRLKIRDIYAKDNFYTVEQGIYEIQAGLGMQVQKHMNDAYFETLENMTRFDLVKNAYVTISDEEANLMFKNSFMQRLNVDPLLQNGNIADFISNLVLNQNINLDSSAVSVERVFNTDGSLEKITVKNITLTRTFDYKKSSVNGTYTQKISSDFEIVKPDFLVLFNNPNTDYSNLFNFALVADCGVEIKQSTPLSIVGNIYGASDYYNKGYNNNNFAILDADIKEMNYKKSYIVGSETKEFSFNHDSVTSAPYLNKLVKNTTGVDEWYDGVNPKSMYSGLYIDNTSVSIFASNLIIPGSVAVMNNGVLSVNNLRGRTISDTVLWADNFILGGNSIKTLSTDSAGETIINRKGSQAIIKADLNIKDDTELNSDGSVLQLYSNYNGFGNSTKKDDRVFVYSVDPKNFTVNSTDASGDIITENRGHYNSSAIIVNGEKATLDLFRVKKLFLAGRTYVELSKDVTQSEAVVDNETVVEQQYTFLPDTSDLTTANSLDKVSLRDYKTGESISLKTNQLAYIPVLFSGFPKYMEAPADTNDGNKYFLATINPTISLNPLFKDHFGKYSSMENGIPCIFQEVSNKKYYYYDFKTIYKWRETTEGSTFTTKFESADDLATSFIAAYTKELSNTNIDSIAKYLIDIGNYEDFEPGEIILPDYSVNTALYKAYSSGAITSKNGTTFNMITNDDISAKMLLEDGTPIDQATALTLAEKLEKEYLYNKWNLGPITDENEKNYIDSLVADSNFGSAYITPLNKFLTMSKITKELKPAILPTDTGDIVLDLSSKYSVWVSEDDVTVKARSADNGLVQGIIITKGNVFFDDNVEKFEGLIVAGGKIFITNNLNEISANPEICRSIIRECQLNVSDNSKFFLELLNVDISDLSDGNEVTENKRTIDSIKYSDVVRTTNFMKNLE